MKLIVHQTKLRDLFGKKLYDFLVLQEQIFTEQNKDVDNSDITLTAEDYDILTKIKKEDWSEDFKKKLPKIEEDILKLSKRGDYAVFTLDEIKNLLTFSDEELKSVIMEKEELI